MGTSKKEYVVGFLFIHGYTSGPKVALIEKKRPAWQHGLLNGIGGKVGRLEGPTAAMNREFLEEAGVKGIDWRRFAQLEFDGGIVFFFEATATQDQYRNVRTMTDETVGWFSCADLLGSKMVVSNLAWLIPMALDEFGATAVVKNGKP